MIPAGGASAPPPSPALQPQRRPITAQSEHNCKTNLTAKKEEKRPALLLLSIIHYRIPNLSQFKIPLSDSESFAIQNSKFQIITIILGAVA